MECKQDVFDKPQHTDSSLSLIHSNALCCFKIIFSLCLQTYLIDLFHKLRKSICRGGRFNKAKTQHQIIADELSSQHDWPPTLSSDSSHLSLAELLKLESGVHGDGESDTADDTLDAMSDDGGSDCDESSPKETDLGLSRSNSRIGDRICLLPVDDSLT